jgi:hypothetical protein
MRGQHEEEQKNHGVSLCEFGYQPSATHGDDCVFAVLGRRVDRHAIEDYARFYYDIFAHGYCGQYLHAG